VVLKEELVLYKLDVNKAESKSQIHRFTVCEQAGLLSSGARAQSSVPFHQPCARGDMKGRR